MKIPVPRTFEDRLEGRPEAVRRATNAIADMGDFAKRGVSPDLPREERKRRNLEELVRNYYRVLLAVDENVGRVLGALDEKKLAGDTLLEGGDGSWRDAFLYEYYEYPAAKKDALEAARFYVATFPDSKVGGVHRRRAFPYRLAG